jgi:hypothetical protein
LRSTGGAVVAGGSPMSQAEMVPLGMLKIFST